MGVLVYKDRLKAIIEETLYVNKETSSSMMVGQDEATSKDDVVEPV